MEGGLPQVNLDRCIGCGVCVRFCPSTALYLERRDWRQFVPKDSVERVILEAIQTNKLHYLICDNFGSVSNQVMGAILKALFSLKPVKRSMAAKQLKSRYITSMVKFYSKFAKNELEGIDLEEYSHPEMENQWNNEK